MPYPVAAARGHTHPQAAAAFVPTDLASLSAWWDFSDITTLWTDAGSTQVTADDDAIYQADDKSGNNFYLTQVSAGPFYKTSIQNGLSIARCNSGRTFTTATTTLGAGSEWSFIGVFQVPSDNAVYVLSGTGPLQIPMRIDTSYTLLAGQRFGGTWRQPTITADNAFHIGWSGIDTAAPNTTIYVGVDGGTPNSLSIASVTIDNATPDIIGTGLGGIDTLDIGELIVCTSWLSTADWNSLGNYLANKWGLSWTAVS